MIAPWTIAMSSHAVLKPRRSSSSACTPHAASSPYAEPPARQIASAIPGCPITPGEPPRTSCTTCTEPRVKWNTVQPVGPSSYSAIPISSPGKSSSSSRIERHRDVARELRVREHELAVRAQRAAAALLVQVREHERRYGLPADAA